jgi:hypothetical protein
MFKIYAMLALLASASARSGLAPASPLRKGNHDKVLQLRGGSCSALGPLDAATAVDLFCKASVVNGIGMALAPDEFMKEAYGIDGSKVPPASMVGEFVGSAMTGWALGAQAAVAGGDAAAVAGAQSLPILLSLARNVLTGRAKRNGAKVEGQYLALAITAAVWYLSAGGGDFGFNDKAITAFNYWNLANGLSMALVPTWAASQWGIDATGDLMKMFIKGAGTALTALAVTPLAQASGMCTKKCVGFGILVWLGHLVDITFVGKEAVKLGAKMVPMYAWMAFMAASVFVTGAYKL